MWTVFPSKLVNAQGYPKGFCDGFWYVNVSLAHFELTEIGSSAPIRTRCPIWKRHGSLLPKGAWVVLALTHPRERTLPNIAKSALPVVMSPAKTSLLKLAIYRVLSLWEKTRGTKLYQWKDKNRSWEHGRLKKTEWMCSRRGKGALKSMQDNQ